MELRVVIAYLICLGILMLGILFTQYLWGIVMVEVFSFPSLNFLQTSALVGLVAITGILLRGEI